MTWANVDPHLCRHIASLGPNELMLEMWHMMHCVLTRAAMETDVMPWQLKPAFITISIPLIESLEKWLSFQNIIFKWFVWLLSIENVLVLIPWDLIILMITHQND